MKSKRKSKKSPTRKPRVVIDYSTLVEDYERGMSMRLLSAKYRISASTVFHMLKKFGVKTRSRSEAQKLFIEKHGHQRAKYPEWVDELNPEVKILDKGERNEQD